MLDKIFVTVCCLLAGAWIAEAQMAISDEITTTFVDDGAALILSDASVADLTNKIEESDFAASLLSVAAQYQIDRDEPLGIELALSDNGRVTLQPASGLNTDQIKISNELLEILESGEFESRIRIDGTIPATEEEGIEEELEGSLSGEGAYAASNSLLKPRKGQEQTVDPVDTGIDIDGLDLVEAVCDTDPNLCADSVDVDEVSADFIRIRADEILQAVANTAQLNAADESCSDAQQVFRSEVEFDAASSGDFTAWRNKPGAQAYAKDFDDACLDKSSSIRSEVLDRLAVLRMPNVETPFCTAFQIGPSTFLTARHCFQNSERGLRRKDRMSRALLFSFRDPTTPIEFKEIQNSEVPETKRLPNKEIRSVEDYIVLEAKISNPAIAPLNPTVPLIGAEVVIPGHFIFADRRNVSLGPDTWKSEIRISKHLAGGYCRIYDFAKSRDGGACLIHRCQVTPGFSGSPVLQFDSADTLRLVGVHVRGEGDLAHHCPARYAIGGINPVSRQGNIAVFPPPNIAIPK